jgi:hypothetical protein
MARNLWLVFFSLTFGPAVGAIVFLILAGTTDAVVAGEGLKFAGAYWPAVVIGAFMFGAPPALLTAIATMILSRWLDEPRQRPLAASATGAVLSPLLFVLMFAGVMLRYPGALLVLAAAGGVAAYITLAFFEWCVPMPSRKKAT